MPGRVGPRRDFQIPVPLAVRLSRGVDPAVPPPGLVGASAAVEKLEAIYANLKHAGIPGTVLIRGPRGSGKTALVKHLGERFAKRGLLHIYCDARYNSPLDIFTAISDASQKGNSDPAVGSRKLGDGVRAKSGRRGFSAGNDDRAKSRAPTTRRGRGVREAREKREARAAEAKSLRAGQKIGRSEEDAGEEPSVKRAGGGVEKFQGLRKSQKLEGSKDPDNLDISAGKDGAAQLHPRADVSAASSAEDFSDDSSGDSSDDSTTDSTDDSAEGSIGDAVSEAASSVLRPSALDGNMQQLGIERSTGVKRARSALDVVSSALDLLRSRQKTVLVIDNADALVDDDLFFYKLLDVVHFRDRVSLLVFTTSDYFLISKLSLRVQSRFVHTLIDVGWCSPWAPPRPPPGTVGSYPDGFLETLAGQRVPDVVKYAVQTIVDRLFVPEAEIGSLAAGGQSSSTTSDPILSPSSGFYVAAAHALASSPLLALMVEERNPTLRMFVRRWNTSLVSLASDSSFLLSLRAFLAVENTPGAVLRVLGDAVEELLYGSAGLGCEASSEPTSGRSGDPGPNGAKDGNSSVVSSILRKHLDAARDPIAETPAVQLFNSLSTEALCLLCILVSFAESSTTASAGYTSVDAVVDEYLGARTQLRLSLLQRQMIKRSDFELFAAGLIYRRKARLYVRVSRAELLEYKASAGGMPGISELFL